MLAVALFSVSPLLQAFLPTPARAESVEYGALASVVDVVDNIGALPGIAQNGAIVIRLIFDVDAPDEDPAAGYGTYSSPEGLGHFLLEGLFATCDGITTFVTNDDPVDSDSVLYSGIVCEGFEPDTLLPVPFTVQSFAAQLRRVAGEPRSPDNSRKNSA